MVLYDARKFKYSALAYLMITVVPVLLFADIVSQGRAYDWWWYIRPALYIYISLYVYEALWHERGLNADGFFKFFMGVQLFNFVMSVIYGNFYASVAHVITFSFLLFSKRIADVYQYRYPDDQYKGGRNMFKVWGIPTFIYRKVRR